jgi:hypothetical protein
MRLTAVILSLLAVLLLASVPADAGPISVTFANATGTTPALFTIVGDSFLTSPNVGGGLPVYSYVSWALASGEGGVPTTWTFSDWALMPDLAPAGYSFYAGGSDLAFQGSSFIAYSQSATYRNYVTSSSFLSWQHNVSIELSIFAIEAYGANPTDSFLSLLNVPGAFRYHEDILQYSSAQYTRTSVDGSLTLVAVGLQPNDLFQYDPPIGAVPSAVPEPSMLSLLGLGLVTAIGYGWKARH